MVAPSPVAAFAPWGVGTVDGWEPLPVARVGPWAMVKMPADINATYSERVGAELAGALAEGVRVLVADMSATRSCDASGARMLMLAQCRAAGRGARLRLLAPPLAVLRTLKRLGVVQVVPVYPALSLAVADTLDLPAPSPADDAPRSP